MIQDQCVFGAAARRASQKSLPKVESTLGYAASTDPFERAMKNALSKLEYSERVQYAIEEKNKPRTFKWW